MLRAFGFNEFEANSVHASGQGREVGGHRRRLGHRHRRTCGPRSKPKGIEYEVDEGGGAFYGPKIDVKIRDAIGRTWQLSTIQYDFNMADRMGLEYVGEDGGPAHAR